MTLEDLKHDINVSAMDIAKALWDYGIHPPTMYFPLIVHEALMVEPTETESKETLDEAIEVFRSIYEKAKGRSAEPSPGSGQNTGPQAGRGNCGQKSRCCAISGSK